MASSITLTSNKHNSRYFKLECTQKSNGGAANTSTISWKLSAIGDDAWYSTGPTTVVINGTTVYSEGRVAWSAGKFPVAQGSVSGTLTVPHNSDGTKKITVKFSTAIYTSTVTEYSESWTLDSIPRYATSVQSLNSKTETTIKMNWSSDSTIDYLWYSKDNGANWTGVNVTDGKSGTYTISGLATKTTYKIKTRVRRKDSQLTTDSSALSVQTYDYPYCTATPNFTIGQKVTLSFYNPLGRTFKFYIIANGVQIAEEWSISGTTYTGLDATNTQNLLYKTIPNAQSAKYKVKTVWGDYTWTTAGNNDMLIDEKKCLPTFTDFSYRGDSILAEVTGNDKTLIEGVSFLWVTISDTQKMVAKNGATPVRYAITIDTISETLSYATTTVGKNLGRVNNNGTLRLSVRAYDSRGLSTLIYKDVVVHKYSKPVINAEVKRLNNYEDQTTISVSGSFYPITVDGVTNSIREIYCNYSEVGGLLNNSVDLSPKITGSNFKCDDVIVSLDKNKKYQFDFEVRDEIRGLTTLTVYVDKGRAIFFISTNQDACFINSKKVLVQQDYTPNGDALESGAYERGRPMYKRCFNGYLKADANITRIALPENAVLRNMYGHIYLRSSSIFVPLNYANPDATVYTYYDVSQRELVITVANVFKGSEYVIYVEYTIG